MRMMRRRHSQVSSSPSRIPAGDGQQQASASSQYKALLGLDITPALPGQEPDGLVAASARAAFDPPDHVIFVGQAQTAHDAFSCGWNELAEISSAGEASSVGCQQAQDQPADRGYLWGEYCYGVVSSPETN